MTDALIENMTEFANAAIACPVCERSAHGGLMPLQTLPGNLQEVISSNAASAAADQACARCVELFSR
ncbi:MAG TPA: hypothetical protein VLQ90_08365, partial [Pyrinomonadaceae bacterium]|nr:hypothetical protein [Pyrinomonadaceae bacterium]